MITECHPFPDCFAYCLDFYAPICGSDGTTYSSECWLNHHNCEQRAKGQTLVDIVEEGECNDLPGKSTVKDSSSSEELLGLRKAALKFKQKKKNSSQNSN